MADAISGESPRVHPLRRIPAGWRRFPHAWIGQQKAAQPMVLRRDLLTMERAVWMANAHPAPTPGEQMIIDLVPLVRKVVAARVRDPDIVEDLVQETLLRVMAARTRVEADTLAPYAAVTARNLVASLARSNERARRVAHLLANDDLAERPEDEVLRQEEKAAVKAALARLSPPEREMLLAHEVHGRDTATLAAGLGSTPGAIAARLNRTRAKLRVEYLLAQEGLEPPTDRCRPVLLALSAGDRRRQRELDAGGHLLGCDFCARLSAPLLDRRAPAASDGEIRVSVATDADVVVARQEGRKLATRAGFSATELTVIATAISEIARNIVKFAKRGEVTVSLVTENERTGVTVVARDVGPGIADVHRAVQDGHSTYGGLGLGLPGARRLMDEFEIVSEVGKGTTVTMTKWR
jgi:RNA polymerase sigma factor (sigma-70 family)